MTHDEVARVVSVPGSRHGDLPRPTVGGVR
jgi:hypothetical protein